MAEEQKPVAWLHNGAGRVDVIHDRIKEIWLKAKPSQVEHYTIPLYLETGKQERENSERYLWLIEQPELKEMLRTIAKRATRG